MHLKRYRRETLQDALRAVREDLGPDALVLCTRLVAAPGVRGWFRGQQVEITAATERTGLSAGRHADTPASAPATARPRPGVPSAQVAANRDAHRAVQEIAARLEATGLDADLAQRVARAHPASTRRGATVLSIREVLADQLAGLSAPDDGYAPVEVFVGPPGVGKTTTIAKIAAQERARHGTRLGLIAADGFRVGAVEQLRLYADIIGSPFTAARTPAELESALAARRRPVLLDTAGRSTSDRVAKDMFAVLAGRQDVRTHLVLSATGTAASTRRTIEHFQDARPTRLVITRLDEVESIAPIVPALRDAQLPISYLGTGQRVPEDLERATPPLVAAWISGDGARPGVTA